MDSSRADCTAGEVRAPSDRAGSVPARSLDARSEQHIMDRNIFDAVRSVCRAQGAYPREGHPPRPTFLRKATCSARVFGPGSPAPRVWPSTRTTGTIPRRLEVMNTSSAAEEPGHRDRLAAHRDAELARDVDDVGPGDADKDPRLLGGVMSRCPASSAPSAPRAAARQGRRWTSCLRRRGLTGRGSAPRAPPRPAPRAGRGGSRGSSRPWRPAPRRRPAGCAIVMTEIPSR